MRRFIINVLTAIAGAACVLIVLTFLFGGRIFAVLSGSMEPSVYTGDAVFVNTNAPFSGVESGEIICFSAANGTNVIHRAVNVTPEGIETKGDANRTSDGISTTKENYVGTVVFNIPLLGYFMRFLSGTRVRIVIFTALAVILILSICRTRVSAKKARKNTNEEQPV